MVDAEEIILRLCVNSSVQEVIDSRREEFGFVPESVNALYRNRKINLSLSSLYPLWVCVPKEAEAPDTQRMESNAQSIVLNYVSQGLKKTKCTRLHTSCLQATRDKHTCWRMSCPRVTKQTSCATGRTKCINRSESMWFVILRDQQPPAFQEGKWGLQVRGAFCFIDLLNN